MGRLCTYADAREHLDDLIDELRAKVEQASNQARIAASDRLGDAISDATARERIAEGFVHAFRENLYRNLVLAQITGRAALVALVLPQTSKSGGKVAISTRNRYTRRTRKRKVFPSDSHKRGTEGSLEAPVRAKGKRARYRDRWLGTFKKTGGKARGLPKLAQLSSHRVGRPEVPRSWRVFKRKCARAKQLEKQRFYTAGKREESGWKPYPYPRKSAKPVKGWSDTRGQRPSSLTDKLREVRGGNLAYLRTLSARQRKKWEDAH